MQKVEGFESLQPLRFKSLHVGLSALAGESRNQLEPSQNIPVISGTNSHVTVSAVLGQLAAGAGIDELLADYPYLEREDFLAALEYAAAAAQEREIASLRFGSG
jgi:uncharacterized protein (DUF433 family)